MARGVYAVSSMIRRWRGSLERTRLWNQGRGPWLASLPAAFKVRRPAALLLPWGLIRQPRSPERLGHRVAPGGPGIAPAHTRLAGSKTFSDPVAPTSARVVVDRASGA